MPNLFEIKELIEQNPVAFATLTGGNKPNVIGVADVKVVSENELIVTDNFMNQTIEDLSQNSSVCLLVWDQEKNGQKLIGKAQYFTEGKWKTFVEQMEENKGYPTKGAILITVSKIISSR